jgi:hypothetical protein
VAPAQLAHRPQVARRVHDHPGRALHERLHDDRGDPVAVLFEDARHVGRVAGLGHVRVEQQRAKERVEEVDAADRHRAQRVAVVAHAQADELVALRLAAVLEVLEGHLQRDLGRRRAVVGEEDAVQPRRRDPDQPLRQLDRAGVAEAEHRRVRDAVELRLHGCVDRRMAMPEHVAPQRRDAVDVGVAVGVEEQRALATLDDRRVLGLPAAHLREGVPDVGSIGGAQALGAHGGHATPARGRRPIRPTQAAREGDRELSAAVRGRTRRRAARPSRGWSAASRRARPARAS